MSEPDQGDWVIPPPEPGTVAFAFRAGPDVELSPAAIGALETLAQELVDHDVSGFQRGSGCGGVFESCNDGKCRPMTNGPCLWYTSCRIVGG